jgi:hypothetical protein
MRPPSPRGELRCRIRDGSPVYQLRCPGCGVWGDIDDDQRHGRVSVDHTNMDGCTFHETRDWQHTAIWLDDPA